MPWAPEIGYHLGVAINLFLDTESAEIGHHPIERRSESRNGISTSRTCPRPLLESSGSTIRYLGLGLGLGLEESYIRTSEMQ